MPLAAIAIAPHPQPKPGRPALELDVGYATRKTARQPHSKRDIHPLRQRPRALAAKETKSRVPAKRARDDSNDNEDHQHGAVAPDDGDEDDNNDGDDDSGSYNNGAAATTTNTTSNTTKRPRTTAHAAHRRSRSGCFTCRLRRKKCSEGRPACRACIALRLECAYERPSWWNNAEKRRAQKERVKIAIRESKVADKAGMPGIPVSGMPPAAFGPHPQPPLYARYGDVEVQHSTTTTTTTYGWQPVPYFPFSYQPAVYQPPAVVPAAQTGPIDPAIFDPAFALPSADQSFILHPDTHPDANANAALTIDVDAALASIPLDDDDDDDEDDRPLLAHFLTTVLRLVFPVLDPCAHAAVLVQAVLPALRANRTYRHCCLSIAAVHLRDGGLNASRESSRSPEPASYPVADPTPANRSPATALETAILRHRFATISELCAALGADDAEHGRLLEATLALILFQTAVGRPDDALPDIPWHQHFQAAVSLVGKVDELAAQGLGEPQSQAPAVPMSMPPLNTALTAWIDILGATMLGRTPAFAHTYRERHLAGTAPGAGGTPVSSGLASLMGCDDAVMYLISEIACLDSLRADGLLGDLELCAHITALAGELDRTEPSPPIAAAPATDNHHHHHHDSRLDNPTTLITALFRLAARVYLCSLVPGFHRADAGATNLIHHFAADLLPLLPAGPAGLDRAVVWPLLVVGVHAMSGSAFRAVFAQRVAAMGDEVAGSGAFGRLVWVLGEVWQLADAAEVEGGAMAMGMAPGAIEMAGMGMGMGMDIVPETAQMQMPMPMSIPAPLADADGNVDVDLDVPADMQVPFQALDVLVPDQMPLGYAEMSLNAATGLPTPPSLPVDPSSNADAIAAPNSRNGSISSSASGPDSPKLVSGSEPANVAGTDTDAAAAVPKPASSPPPPSPPIVPAVPDSCVSFPAAPVSPPLSLSNADVGAGDGAVEQGAGQVATLPVVPVVVHWRDVMRMHGWEFLLI